MIKGYYEKGAGIYGDGSDGDVTISGSTTLSRDMYYNNLTVNAAIVTNAYRVFIKNTLTIGASGSFTQNGASGDNGVADSGGNGGSGSEIPHAFANMQFGASGGFGGGLFAGPGDDGSIGFSTAGYGGIGGDSGFGGNSPLFNGGNAVGGDVFPIFIAGKYFVNWVTITTYYTQGYVAMGGGGSGASGAGGAGDGVDDGGGGGGSGQGGGVIGIWARNIVHSGAIQCKGGNGGNGAPAYAGNTGGGGGAGGAGGGLIYLFFDTLTGTGTYSVAGGTKGTGGAGIGTGTAGTDGTNGGTGYIVKYNRLSGTFI